METLRQITRRLALDSGGSEIAEAAAVLPLMFMVLLGIFWFGQAFSIYGAITRAAQEGARAGASSPVCTPASPNTLPRAANAVSAVQAALQDSRLDPTQAQKAGTATGSYFVQRGTPVLRHCASAANFVFRLRFSLTVIGDGATDFAECRCRLQYPFQFWLPVHVHQQANNLDQRHRAWSKLENQ